MPDPTTAKPAPDTADLVEELRWRGMLHQVTDEQGLKDHLASGTRRIYAGFDPTENSLTIGNLVTIMALAHAKRAGHEAIVVMGGGTGLIGDPSGKSAERRLMTRETVVSFIDAQRPIYDAVLHNVSGPNHRVLNNLKWLGELSFIDALRDIGKHFSVNMMMQKESVKERLHNREQGISYTEFSYMILQAYDFAHLFKEDEVTVQFGGSDQFGNIVAGIDHIRRVWVSKISDLAEEEQKRRGLPADSSFPMEVDYEPRTAFGLTWPLVTKSDGGKFGKTESGAVWLTADRTSPYAYYQFWLNATDEDAASWLGVFTFLSKEEVEDIREKHAAEPFKRLAQRTLAQEATTILHGESEMKAAEAAAQALFSGNIKDLPESLIEDVFNDVPSSDHAKAALEGDGIDLVEFLIETGLAKSKRESREFITNGSVSINGDKVTEGATIKASDLLHSRVIAIRRGKKAWHLTRWA